MLEHLQADVVQQVVELLALHQAAEFFRCQFGESRSSLLAGLMPAQPRGEGRARDFVGQLEQLGFADDDDLPRRPFSRGRS
ncbi:hypothetical protein DMH04_04785 [Kibdelosporangium aridum]|uniref:Uncharacterized protein n=1 Tax=Kibdelosporangium aridum TaxID=2030 RepID=A0A428ZRU3_KIBAR|nr:hypothetical protein [Kibdelosporangium aridum]RSM90772.1 hypothetical protein DMH04_04785 [Kibdelosporangium aridum]